MKATIVLSCLLFMVIGCTKNLGTTAVVSDQARVVYQRTDPSKGSLTLAEDITLGSAALSSLVKIPDWNTAVSRFGPLSAGQRYTYDNSPVTITRFAVNSGQSVLVYSYEKQYIIALLSTWEKDSITIYQTGDINGKAYHAVLVDRNLKIKDVVVTDDRPMGGQSFVQSGPRVESVASTCPENYPGSFIQCFHCAVMECSNDLLCSLACGFQPASCVLGFSLACALPIK